MVLDPVNAERVNQIRKELEIQFSKPVTHQEIQAAVYGVPIRSNALIEVTKLNDKRFGINSEMIETVEETPDTVITMVTGRKYIVKESSEEIGRLCVEFKRKIFHSGE